MNFQLKEICKIIVADSHKKYCGFALNFFLTTTYKELIVLQF